MRLQLQINRLEEELTSTKEQLNEINKTYPTTTSEESLVTREGYLNIVKKNHPKNLAPYKELKAYFKNSNYVGVELQDIDNLVELRNPKKNITVTGIITITFKIPVVNKRKLNYYVMS